MPRVGLTSGAPSFGAPALERNSVVGAAHLRLFSSKRGKKTGAKASPRPRELLNQLKDLAGGRVDSTTRQLIAEIEKEAVPIIKNFNFIDLSQSFSLYGRMSVKPGRAMLEGLEAQVKARIDTFDEQGISNVMHGYAKLGLLPGKDVLSILEGRIKAVAEEFKPQAIANTLWAYATLGMEPGAGVVRVLEGRMEAVGGTFIAQNIANTLWAYAVFGSSPSESILLPICQAAEAFIDQDAFTGIHLSQLHMFLLVAKLEGWSTRGVSNLGSVDALRSKLGSRGRDQIAQSPVGKTSRLQADVASCVCRLGLEYEEEAIDEESGYSIDVLVRYSGQTGDGTCRKSMGVALEVDGPSHYLLPGERDANGSTLLKRRVLSQLGYQVVSVPHWEWDDATKSNKGKDVYLRRVLGIA